jgi:hypothetical protein
MTKHTLIIVTVSLLGVGLLITLVNSLLYRGGGRQSGPTIDQALKSASDQSFGSQSVQDSAKSIIQQGIAKNDQTTAPIENSEFDEYKTSFDLEDLKSFTKIDNLQLLEKYKVDTLLDGTIVYSLTREAIGQLNLDKYYRLGYDEELCRSTCVLVKTKIKYLVLDYNIYYLSSFTKDSSIVWIGLIKNSDGYVYAKIAEPNFLNPKLVYFTGGNVIKINQKSSNSSEYSFDIKNGDSASVNFAEKNLETPPNPVEAEVLYDIQNPTSGYLPQGDD